MTNPRFKAEYGLSRIIRYQGKRQRFFDNLHRFSLFANSVFGSSAFVTIVSGHSFFAALLTAAVAIISAIDNVVGFAERARVYSEQRRRYYDLYCEILISDPNKFNADQFREKRLRIDRDGPPPLRVLDVLCRNEEDIARGYNHDETIYVAWWRRLVAQFIDLPSRKWHSFEQLAQARNA